MNNNSPKNKPKNCKIDGQSLMLTRKSKDNGFSVRLAKGESWGNRSVELAMLVAGDTYLNKLHVPQPTNDVGSRINQVTIRRNSFTPEFEPTRHEMRIFDTLDGVVTEM